MSLKLLKSLIPFYQNKTNMHLIEGKIRRWMSAVYYINTNIKLYFNLETKIYDGFFIKSLEYLLNQAWLGGAWLG